MNNVVIEFRSAKKNVEVLLLCEECSNTVFQVSEQYAECVICKTQYPFPLEFEE